MALDLPALWDFSKPELSEQRFRAALVSASADDALILHTQIARSHGLRRDFAAAREQLQAVQAQLPQRSAEARARWWLEMGRTWASATHPAGALTPSAKTEARRAYQTALDTARLAGLDGLAIDAIHMFAFTDTAPAEQQAWAEQALAVALASKQPAAQNWEASIRNNLGLALHQQGRYAAALAQFEQALALRERQAAAAVASADAAATARAERSVRVARWMLAWTYRALGRLDEAIAIQTQLEQQWQAAGEPDPYVFEELELLYQAQGQAERAAHYAALLRTHQKP
jgi:tetratricopeptide (TPR) repeat protein